MNVFANIYAPAIIGPSLIIIITTKGYFRNENYSTLSVIVVTGTGRAPSVKLLGPKHAPMSQSCQ